VADLDGQASATRWAKQSPDETPFPATIINLAAMGDKVHLEIQKHLKNYDFIIADCPPSKDALAPAQALTVSDIALIPVKPSPLDMWATQQAKQVADGVRVARPDLIVRVVPVMAVTSSNLAKGTLELIKEDTELIATKAHLGQRIAFQESQLLGDSVHALRSRDDKAVAEVEALTDEILSILAGPRPALTEGAQ
jgi:chromosome partitioning protein